VRGVAQPKAAGGSSFNGRQPHAPQTNPPAARNAGAAAAVSKPTPQRPSPFAKGATIQRSWDKRPSFTSDSKKAAIYTHNYLRDFDFELDEDKPDLSGVNGAMPHRYSWNDIRNSTKRYVGGKEDDEDFKRWTKRFIKAGKEKIRETQEEIDETEREIAKKKVRIRDKKLELASTFDVNEEEALKKKIKRLRKDKSALERKLGGLKSLRRRQKSSQENFVSSRKELIDDTSDTGLRKEFLRQANSFHANVPDIGPHFGVNNPVSKYGHLNLRPSRHDTERRGRKRQRSPSPMSRRVLDMSPERVSGMAVTKDDEIITVSGETFRPRMLRKKYRSKFKKHDTKEIKSFKEDFNFGS